MNLKQQMNEIIWSGDADPYKPEIIAELGDCAGTTLPDDLRTYLETAGSRRIEYDAQTLFVRQDDYLHALSFEGARPDVFVVSDHGELTSARGAAALPQQPQLYVPFGRIEGGMNPSLSLWVASCASDEDRGAIWAVDVQSSNDETDPIPPIRLADDLAGFLGLLGNRREHEDTAITSNAALLLKHIDAYEAQNDTPPTRDADPKKLLHQLFSDPEQVLFDGARNVLFQARVRNESFVTAADVRKSGDFYTVAARDSPYIGIPHLARDGVQIDAPVPFEGPRLLGTQHGLAVIRVQSVIGTAIPFEENYLMHRTENGWSIVRRLEAKIDDLTVKGVGTFAFDQREGWHLKRKIGPAWSDVPFDVNIQGREDALTKDKIELVRQIKTDAAFRDSFEGELFAHYTEVARPGFEALPPDERAEWEDAFPTITSPFEIWGLIDKQRSIFIDGDGTVTITVDTHFEPEHGYTRRIDAWAMK